jgi:hypothetical protein
MTTTLPWMGPSLNTAKDRTLSAKSRRHAVVIAAVAPL